MVTDIIPVSVISGTSKKTGKDFTILHYVYKDTLGRFQTFQQFGGSEDLVDAFKKICDNSGSFKKVKGELQYINGNNYLLSITV